MRGTVALLSVLALWACEGPTGPEGPQGPAGIEGPAGAEGPGTRVTYTGQLDEDGSATVSLPAAAGDIDDLPVIACYESSDGSTWGIVTDGWDDSDSTVCMVTEDGDGNLIVVFFRGLEGWYYSVSVVY